MNYATIDPQSKIIAGDKFIHRVPLSFSTPIDIKRLHDIPLFSLIYRNRIITLIIAEILKAKNNDNIYETMTQLCLVKATSNWLNTI